MTDIIFLEKSLKKIKTEKKSLIFVIKNFGRQRLIFKI